MCGTNWGDFLGTGNSFNMYSSRYGQRHSTDHLRPSHFNYIEDPSPGDPYKSNVVAPGEMNRPSRMSSAASSTSMGSSGLSQSNFKITEAEINEEVGNIPREELQQIRDVFEYIDKDGSNTISLEELEAIFDCLPQKLSKYEVTRMFNMLDDDNDGTIDFFEFACMWNKVDNLFGLGKRSSAAEVKKMKKETTGSKMLDIFDDSRFKEPEFVPTTKREILWAIVDDPTYSELSRLVSTVIMTLIMISCISFILENDPNVKKIEGGKHVFQVIETVCVIIFSVEFALRVSSTPDYCAFFTDLLNWIDLIAVLPFYLQLVLSNDGEGVDTAYVRVLRLFRVFRVMKFSKYLTWVKLIIAALSDSLIPLSMAIFVMTIALLIFASVLFFVEVQGGQAVFVPEQKMWVYKSTGDPTAFESIMDAIYFCVITMTTVGYGDQTIRLTLTKFFTSICAIAGTILLAIPISVFSTNFEIQFHKHSREQAIEQEKLMQAQLNEALQSAQKKITLAVSMRHNTKNNQKGLLSRNEPNGREDGGEDDEIAVGLSRALVNVAEKTALEAAAVVDNAMGGVDEMKNDEDWPKLKQGEGEAGSNMLEFLMKHESKKIKDLVSQTFGPAVQLDDELVPRINGIIHTSRLELWTKLSKLERDHVQDVCKRFTHFFKRHFPETNLPTIPNSNKDVRKRRRNTIHRLRSEALKRSSAMEDADLVEELDVNSVENKAPELFIKIGEQKVNIFDDNVDEFLKSIPEDDDEDRFTELVSPLKRKKLKSYPSLRNVKLGAVEEERGRSQESGSSAGRKSEKGEACVVESVSNLSVTQMEKLQIGESEGATEEKEN